MNILEKVVTGYRLVKQEEIRLKKEKEENEKISLMSEEAEAFLEQDISYIETVIQQDMKSPKTNQVKLFKELNRIELSLSVDTPTIFSEYGDKPTTFYNRVYVRNGEMSPYEKQLTQIEETLLQAAEHREEWPPAKANLDDIAESAWYALYCMNNKTIKTIQSIIDTIKKYR